MGIIDRIRGNPFDRLKLDQLGVEKIKLDRRERLVIGDIRTLSGKQKLLIKSGFGKDISEQRVLARQIDQADKQVKLKNIQLKRLSEEIKVVDNFIFVQENREFLEDSGFMKVITKIPKNKLSEYLGQINLKERLERDKVTGVLHTMESEFGLVGDVEDDTATSELLDMWNSEEPLSETDVFEQWQSRRESTESTTGG
jgi:hypothetical protein